MPIPCLHRIHKDEDVLVGAHKIQNRIGMSLSLSSVEQRLRQLANLSAIVGKTAIVTFDDGFRDVILLKEIFRELSPNLQPVLFVPSALLRENDTNFPKRHLSRLSKFS